MVAWYQISCTRLPTVRTSNKVNKPFIVFHCQCQQQNRGYFYHPYLLSGLHLSQLVEIVRLNLAKLITSCSMAWHQSFLKRNIQILIALTFKLGANITWHTPTTLNRMVRMHRYLRARLPSPLFLNRRLAPVIGLRKHVPLYPKRRNGSCHRLLRVII